MRQSLWWPLLLAMTACCLNLGSVKAKPLVSLGLGVQSTRPTYNPYSDPYYNNYYGYGYGNGNGFALGYGNGNGYGYGYGYGSNRYPSGYPYQPPTYYPASYSPGHRYGALDIGIGALSLTPFLL